MQRGWVEDRKQNCSVVQTKDDISRKGTQGERTDVVEVQFASLVTDEMVMIEITQPY